MSEATANLSAVSDPTTLPTAGSNGGAVAETNADGTAKKRKGPKKGSKRNKPSKVSYAVPEGKLQSPETHGFDSRVHRKLTVNDFADPLHYSQWNVSYYEGMLANAKAEVSEMQSMGSTPEERNAAKEFQRLAKAMENYIARRAQSGAALPGSMQQRLGDMYGKVSMQ